jgi:hypothetical protein
VRHLVVLKEVVHLVVEELEVVEEQLEVVQLEVEKIILLRIPLRPLLRLDLHQEEAEEYLIEEVHLVVTLIQ